MFTLAFIGRKFYSISIIVIGFLTMYYADFPYMLIPQQHSWIPGLAMVSYGFGAMFIVAGSMIFFEKKAVTVSLLLGAIFLFIFCFCFVPYQFMVSQNFMKPGDWENAEKELALAGGALVVAGSLPGKTENAFTGLIAKIIPAGPFIYAFTIVSFGIDHFLYARQAADYVPGWIPDHLFWIYLAGIALLGSAIAIILKIRTRLFAMLLGIMIFIWFIILHTPYVIAARFSDTGGEVTSALLALAYSGTAFLIAGNAKRGSGKLHTVSPRS